MGWVMKLFGLQLRNIFSYGNNITDIPLNFDSPTLIIGENYDATVDGELDSNGSGKSAILNSLVYAFYGKTLEGGIKLDELINNINKKNLYVSVTFQANDGLFYTIERWRKNKALGGTANNGVKITWGETIDTIKNDKSPAVAIDKYIAEHILGMDFDIFVRIVTISGSLESFLNLPTTSTNATSQVSIIEEIFGQTILTEKGAILKDKVKETKADIVYLDELNTRIKAETKRYEEQLDMAKKSVKDWDADQKFKIEEIKTEIIDLKAVDYAKELGIIEQRAAVSEMITNAEVELSGISGKLELNNNNVTASDEWKISNDRKLTSTKQLLVPYTDVDFDAELVKLNSVLDKESEIVELTGNKANINGTLETIIESIDKLEAELLVLKESKCPYCEQDYTDNLEKIDTIEDKVLVLRDAYDDNHENIAEIDVTCIQLQDEIDNTTECMYSSLRDFDAGKNAYDGLVKTLKSVVDEECPYTSLLIEDDVLLELNARKVELDELLVSANAALTVVGESKYTPDVIYAKQAKLKSITDSLDEKTSEINPHIATVGRLDKVFDNIDELQVDEADNLRVYLKHQEFMVKLLTRKDSHIRQALLDINLPMLNKQIKYYLDAIGLFHNVSFTKDMSVLITQFGNGIGFSSLSTGQKARINLAMAFAFRDVVQARHQKVNFCILDECLDKGLGNLGVKLAAKMIKNVADDNDLSMYVITHRDEIKASFDKTLKTMLKGGITTVEFS
jgi:DNA repair exonuclease SbcCD ATPase subunit